MTMLRTTAMAAVLVIAGGASLAGTTTIDFTGEPFGPLAGETYATSKDGLDLIFAGPGLNFRGLGGGFDTTYGLNVWLSTTGDTGPITLNISGAPVTAVSFLNPVNGSVNSEVDTITAQAFDGADALIDSIVSGDEFITLSGVNIARLTFAAPDTGFVLGSLEFTTDMAPVPLPASGLGLGAAALALVALRRTRRAA